MSPLLRRVTAPALGVIACAALLAATRGLDDVVPGRQLGPAFWPRMILAGLAITCLARIASAVRAAWRGPGATHRLVSGEGPPRDRALGGRAAAIDVAPEQAAPWPGGAAPDENPAPAGGARFGEWPPLGEVPADAPLPISWPTLVASLGLVFGYVVATPHVGFPVATVVFVGGFMALCGARSFRGIGAAAVVGTVALLYLFVKAVYLPLPKGDGPFEALTLGLYRVLRIF